VERVLSALLSADDPQRWMAELRRRRIFVVAAFSRPRTSPDGHGFG